MTHQLSLPQRAAVALNTAEHEAQLIELAKSSADIVAVANAAGRDQAHRIGMTLRNARTNITKVGKAARDDATAFGKAVIAEETRLVSIIEPEEKRVIGLRDKWDAEIEAERQAKIAAERARNEGIQMRINEIIRLKFTASGKPSIEVRRMLDLVRDIACTEAEFDEFADRAMAARSDTFNALEAELDVAVAREAEAASQQAEREAAAEQAKKEREELAAAQAELKRQQAEAAADMQRQRDAMAAEMKAEREKAEALRKLEDDKRRFEQQQERDKLEKAHQELMLERAQAQAVIDEAQRQHDAMMAIAAEKQLAAARALEQETATVAVVESATPPAIEMVTITKAEYERLLDREDWLECLEAAGVDNWSGYDYAIEMYNEEQV